MNFIPKILIIIGLCLTSANAPTIEALQDQFTQSVRAQIIVSDEEAITRPVSSVKPRPKTFYPVLLPFNSVVVRTTVEETTHTFTSRDFATQTFSHYARGPPIS